MTNDLLPDEIYYDGADAWDCARHSNVTKYIRADLVSTPNKPAEGDLIPDRTDEILVRDLQTTLRMFNSRKEPLSASEITTTLGTEKLIQIIDFALRYYRAALSGHLATGKGGGEPAAPTQIDAGELGSAVESLKAVLCDPEGKCCIPGSDADIKIIDDALSTLTHLSKLSGGE